jgi:hypothetical protein
METDSELCINEVDVQVFTPPADCDGRRSTDQRA